MALQSLQKLSPTPDLLITGGDHVMDSLKTNHDKLDPMWDLYSKTLRDNTDLAVRPIIGNHDVLVQGNVVPSEATRRIATGSRKLVRFDREALALARTHDLGAVRRMLSPCRAWQ